MTSRRLALAAAAAALALVAAGVSVRLGAGARGPDGGELARSLVLADRAHPSPSPRAERRPAGEPGAPGRLEAGLELAASPTAPASASRRLEARFVDPWDRPVAGVRLVARCGERAVRARSDAGGRVALWLPPGAARAALEARAPGRGTWRGGWSDLGSPVGRGVHLGEIVLAPGAAVSGRVLDAGGEPVAGALVQVVSRDALSAAVHGAPRRPDESGARLAVRTDARGRFHVEGVPLGHVAVAARPDPRAWSLATAPLALALEGDARGLVLFLPPDEPHPGRELRGRVVDESGAPAVDVEVACSWRDPWAPGGEPSLLGATDASGRFRFDVPPGAACRVRALDRRAPVRGAELDGVRAGPDELRLVLRPAPTLELLVRDGRGRSVERFFASVLTADRFAAAPEPWSGLALGTADATPFGETFSWADHERHAGGRARLALPGESFFVSVASRGFRRRVLGPLEPDQVSGALEVELAPHALLRGRVRADGRPVAGARVRAHAVYEGPGTLFWNGLPAPIAEDRPAAVGTTDERGRFALAWTGEGAVRVSAEAPGRALATSPVLRPTPGERVDGLELELGPGGALEGRVRAPVGRDPAGVVVVATRHDGHPRVQRTDADGTFRFEHLAPGGWHVLARPAGASAPSGGELVAMEPGWEPPVSARVDEGGTARVELDLRDGPSATLAGRLVVDGRPAEGWVAELGAEQVGARSLVRARDRSRVGPAGTFELGLPEPGRATLRLARGELELWVPLELVAGRTPWTERLASARLSGRLDAAGPTHAQLVLRGEAARADGTLGEPLAWRLPVRADETGSFALEGLPAGRARLVLGERVLAEVVLEPGGHARVELP